MTKYVMGYFVFKPSFLVIFFYTNLMNAEYSVKEKKENNFRVSKVSDK